ncbi:MAG: hypothetical protein KJ621_13130 [Proteobacteria bacterium]|nr:hypothetical protein [Pseudomonadota bacterium]MBU1743210.1 hypothetical protein [Pseudomonadota bacterium]
MTRRPLAVVMGLTAAAIWHGPAAWTAPSSPQKTFIQSHAFPQRLAAWQRLVREGRRIPAVLALVERAAGDHRVLPRLSDPGGGRLLRAVLRPPARPATPVRFRPRQVEVLQKFFPKLRLLGSEQKGYFVVLYHGVVQLVLADAYLRHGLTAEAQACLAATADYALALESRATATLHRTVGGRLTEYQYYKLTEVGRIMAALGRRLRRMTVAYMAKLLLGGSRLEVRFMAGRTLAALGRRLPLPLDVFRLALARETDARLKAALRKWDRELTARPARRPH